AVKKTLIERAGMSGDHILIMTDESPAQRKPTLANLRREVPAFLKKFAKDDRVIVFFSSHGMLEKGQTYLVPQDFTIGKTTMTGLAMTDMRQWLADCPAKTKFVILDCCHAGSNKAVVGKKAPSAEEVARLMDEDPVNGCVVLASCRAKESSW